MANELPSKRGKTKTIADDVSAQLRTPEERAAYLDAWLVEAPEDAAGIARALGDIARAKGMTQVARDTGLSRESLYKALGQNGNPSFATILKVARALGVQLHAQPVRCRAEVGYRRCESWQPARLAICGDCFDRQDLSSAFQAADGKAAASKQAAILAASGRLDPPCISQHRFATTPPKERT